ncbi:hypothetical protein FQZ97_462730 [compost metagenome]
MQVDLPHHLPVLVDKGHVGQGEHVLDVVRDHQDRDAPLLAHLRELVAQLGAQHGVERGKGFVEQQHLRLAGQRARQGHALLLAAREFLRPAVGQRGEAEAGQQRLHALGVAGRQRAAVPRGEPEGHVLAHREVREQRVVLEQVADAARRRRHVDALRGVVQRAAVEPHMARRGMQQAGDGLQGERLAGPRGAIQRGEGNVGLEAHGEVEAPGPVLHRELQIDIDHGLPKP